MQIQIIAVSNETKTTAGGKPYVVTEVTYKNLTFGGKTESKKIMPFGATQSAAKVMSESVQGEVYEVSVVKNDKGYNDWTSVNKTVAGATVGAGSGSKTATSGVGGGAPTATPKSNYETPEERAKRQIYIVRQSSISSAIEMLGTGSKAKLTTEEVLAVAKEFEGYVFGEQTAARPSALKALDKDAAQPELDEDDLPF